MRDKGKTIYGVRYSCDNASRINEVRFGDNLVSYSYERLKSLISERRYYRESNFVGKQTYKYDRLGRLIGISKAN